MYSALMSMNASERLIEATRELLWERGYVGTSPKAVQQAAGAGQGSMYHHFAGKQDLALAAIRRSAEELGAAAEAVLGGGGSAYARVEAYLLRERDVLRGCPVGRLTMDPEVIADPGLRAPVEEVLGRVRGRLAEVVREGVDSGEFSPALDPDEIAASVLATVQGGYVLARATGSRAPFDSAVRGLLALLAPSA
ncbi:TetR/AcrR family transcriptional regulator [Streptomyces sp. NPDC004288]|uniref:TetR/AcrR family transcriptional regulator n=1 Tax=unclassified Streptomyces TaxID=2593676 RepID=UPI002E78D627|nr:TetR/AcrR family transcriptional regulator [Streptomyces sp. SP18ES09]MEE1813851.1 TetR/AcrR family transcriptional regulator [Streptomyces sp. SP18ES09]